MWKNIRLTYNVLFMDSTSKILKKFNSQPECQLFSMVFHDRIRQKIIPVAEFFSSKVDTPAVSKYLVKINHILHCNNNLLNTNRRAAHLLPLVVVSDFCWPNLNSILNIFNRTTMSIYLKWAYDLFIKFPNDLDFFNLNQTKLKLCSLHFLRSIIRAIRKLNTEIENVKEVRFSFLFSVTLLLESKSMSEFESNFKRIYLMFCIQNINKSVNESIDFLSKSIQSRNDEFLKFYLKANVDADLSDENKKNKLSFYKNYEIEQIKSLKKESAFSEHFNLLINEIIKSITIDDAMEKNKYFCPQLFELIKSELYLMPLWSDIVIEKCKQFKLVGAESIGDKLTNNIVESHFSSIKNVILNRQKNLNPSEYVAPIYKSIRVVWNVWKAEGERIVFLLIQLLQIITNYSLLIIIKRSE